MNRSTGPVASASAPDAPSTPITAPVIEYACLFSHDLKRKQKRWKDGRLKFHAFNKRIMVYDERGNSIGDMHWQESAPLDEGDEINLDRGGVVVQVGECKGARDQDITQLLVRKTKVPAPPQTALSARKSPGTTGFNPPRPAVASFQTPSRGPLGRAVPQTRSPFEERQAAAAAAAAVTDATSPDQSSPPPAKRRRFEERQQKPAYATSLFGAALTLSGSSGSAPMLPRQGIPRLHAVDQRVQPTGSVTSLRASYRQTRAPERPEEEGTPRQPRTPAQPKQAPGSVRQAFREMAARTVDVLDIAADRPSAKAPRPREPTKRMPDIDANTDTAPRPTKRTKDTHPTPAARTCQPDKPAQSVKPVQFPKPAQLSKPAHPPPAFTTTPATAAAAAPEPVTLPPASQPRIELRLGSKRKRKGLMIAAAPPPVLALTKSPTPEMVSVQAQKSAEEGTVAQKDGDRASNAHGEEQTAGDERAEKERAEEQKVAEERVHEATAAAFDDLEGMIAGRSKTALDASPEPFPVPHEPAPLKSPLPLAEPTREKSPSAVGDDFITVESSSTSAPESLGEVESDVARHSDQVEEADSLVVTALMPSSPEEEAQKASPLAQASLRPESPQMVDGLQVPQAPSPKEPPLPPSPGLPSSPGLPLSPRPPSLGPPSPRPPSPGLFPEALNLPLPIPGESSSSPEQPLSSPIILPESFLSTNNAAKFLEPDSVALSDDESGRPSKETGAGDSPDHGAGVLYGSGEPGKDLIPQPVEGLQDLSESTTSAPQDTDSSNAAKEPTRDQNSTRSSLRRTPSAATGFLTKQQPFRVPSLLKKSTSTVSAASACAPDVSVPHSLSRSHSSSTRSGLSSIIARTEGALHADTPLLSTTAAAIAPRLGAAKESAGRMGGFAPASVVRMEKRAEKETEWVASQESRVEDEVKLVLPPVQRFPGFTRISGDAWSREAYDLFEWKRPVA